MIETSRLLLRRWRDEDFIPFAALNADPIVRRWWSAGPLNQADSHAQAERLRRHIEDHGFGFWAVEVSQVSPFIGFVGLQNEEADMPFAPAIEAGWRLARAYWGQGYAIEAARAAFDDGFGRLGMSEIVAYAVEGNMPSRRVMERLGMHHDQRDDFNHPHRKSDDPFRRHVLYRLRSPG
ncbi:GNAT family N-acetyltransferase [Methylobacterium sp. Leaf93]|uniref:GNAT family N-acetyltransferase n=1 Tax=Methylobacterium sp. Leaf93 TaxID=1736249 RepID=UPI0009E72836|nr:GNAT family N-acetyltransferase [Methylobacterium sp. Leaf93]